jgi:hypothetical protein
MFPYPDEIKSVLRACREFKLGVLKMEQLQERLWEASVVISSIEARDVMNNLRRVESELERIRFLKNVADQPEAARRVVDKLVDELNGLKLERSLSLDR